MSEEKVLGKIFKLIREKVPGE